MHAIFLIIYFDYLFQRMYLLLTYTESVKHIFLNERFGFR
jgi:hypothetical protein